MSDTITLPVEDVRRLCECNRELMEHLKSVDKSATASMYGREYVDKAWARVAANFENAMNLAMGQVAELVEKQIHLKNELAAAIDRENNAEQAAKQWEAACVALREALAECRNSFGAIQAIRWGWDGDCGAKTAADDGFDAAHTALEATHASAAAELAELLEDKARLDWLDEHMTYFGDGSGGTYSFRTPADVESGLLRVAIDAARKDTP